MERGRRKKGIIFSITFFLLYPLLSPPPLLSLLSLLLLLPPLPLSLPSPLSHPSPLLPPLPSPTLPLSPPRSVSGMVSTVKTTLSVHQKRLDFRPEDPGVPQQTDACQKIIVYIDECRQVLDQSLDGKNLDLVLLEFGIRLQRVIYEHIQQFVINESGRYYIVASSVSCCTLFLFVCFCSC